MRNARARLPLRSGGHLWGSQRVAAGISIRQLAARSGVARGMLTLMEHGRLLPTNDEYQRIVAALDELRHSTPDQVQ